MIAAVLAELHRLLPSGRLRHRVLLESEDHLRCAVEAGIATGLDPAAAEAEAVTAFGPPAALARRVREDLGTRAAGAGSRLGLALLGVLAAVYALRFTEVANDSGQPRWWPDSPLLSLVTLLAIEVAVVAGAVIVVRLLRHRSGATAGAVRAPLLRGVLVAAVSGAVAALAGGVTALLHTGEVRASGLALTVVGLDAAVLVLAVATTSVCVRGLLVAGASGTEPHVVDDAAGLLPARVGRALGSLAGRHPRLATLVDLRRHPWRTCATAAVAVACLQAVGQSAAEGLGVALALGAVQGAALVAAFTLVGPALGLRGR